MIDKKIKELRKYLGLTQTDFGKALEKKMRTIQQWESGKITPPEAALKLITAVYGVNETWLRTGQGKMFETLHHSENDMQNTGRVIGKAGTVHSTGNVGPVQQVMLPDLAELNELILEYGSPKILKQFISKMNEIKKLHDEN